MKTDQDYDLAFFSANDANAIKSAEVIVPLIIELLSPRSVIDIGCGTGIWLAGFKSHDIDDITGVDGHWVQDEMLRIPKSCFITHDLTRSLNTQRRYDLAISLEVAEHLEEQHARHFVSTLVKLSSVVLFSAATPFQDGIHHVNEAWPDYWADLFKEHEYVPIDCIREMVWKNKNVAWYYAQNILVFAEKQHVSKNSKLQKAFERTRVSQLSVVHPRNYLRLAHSYSSLSSSLRQVLQLLPGLMIKTIKTRLNLRTRS